MKRLVAAALLLIVAGSLVATMAACGDGGAEAASLAKGDVTVDSSYSGKEVSIGLGKELTVILESNPSTGFSWFLTENSDENVITLVDNRFQPAESGLLGAPGQDAWTFKAQAKGQSTITLEYHHPWWENEEPEQTFQLTIIVE